MNGIHSLLFPSLFLVKFCVGLFFLFVYTYIYGGGELSADAGAFYQESKILHNVFYKSPSDYFRYLFNIDLSPDFVDKHLSLTQHWNGTTKPIFNDSQNVIRINSLLFFLSKGEVLTHILFMCAFSFWGVFESYKWIREYSRIKVPYLLIAIMLIPSVTFWSSSFIKEPLLILGVGLLLNACFSSKNSVPKKTMKGILGGVLVLAFKPYVLICFTPVLIFLLVRRLMSKQAVLLSLIVVGIIGSSLFLFPKIKSKIVHKISRQQTDFINVGLGGLHLFRNDTIYFFEGVERGKMKQEGNMVYLLEETEGNMVVDKVNYGMESLKIPADKEPWHILYQSKGSASQFKTTRINNSLGTMVKMIPEVLVNVLFRPFPGDHGSWLIYPAMVENYILFFAFVIIVFFYRRKLSKKELEIAIALLLFILTLYLIIGYTTPVSGAIVRYKIPGVLAMVLLICLFFKPKTKIQ